LAVVLLCGCGASANDEVVGGCIADNPPSTPFDVGDVVVPAQPPSEPGGEAIVGPAPTAADIALQCQQSGGSGCEERAFISRDAATCLAQTSGVAEGERPWEVSLGYFDNHKRVGWLMMTVAGSTRDGGNWGDAVVLDATTGGELSRSTYTATP
jgi:hypothetical protein